MQHDRLVPALAGVLGAITVVMTILGLVYSPGILFVALTFGVATYLVYYHASGRLAARVYRSVERRAATDPRRERRRRAARAGRRSPDGRAGSDGRRGGDGERERGGFGAGPREQWTPPRDGASARQASDGGRRRTGHRGQGAQGRTGQQRTRQRRRPPGASSGPTAAQAYRTLGLDPDADEASVKRAYREKVKEVHPDADGGDEERFKEVTAAYERLTD